ncbi:MAG: O-antigen ligase family protein [candidate division KSB1 bacterium]|nr:O-antigen ligase family protein [candidate division KSB1 bacterium]MDZ7295525.1 O-antigen ligase family protein [candidate division KSB1 bacterium]MDZ7391569.1 O-antigen ligase family protein [candidate division KSB1 bacterium]
MREGSIDTTGSLDRTLAAITRGALYVTVAAMPFSIAVTQTALAVAVLAWLSRMAVQRRLLLQRTSLELAFVLYVAAELVALVFSVNVPNAVVYLKRLLLIATVYVVGSNVESERTLQRLMATFLLAMSLYSLWGVGSFVVNPSVRVRHIQNSMTAGGLTMMATVVAAAVACEQKETRVRLLALAAAIANGVCLFLTNTRGSWLGLAVALVVMASLVDWRLVVVVPVLAILAYLAVPGEYKARVSHFFDPHYRTNAYRITWWKTGWRIFKDHPVTGVGDIDTGAIYRQYMGPEETQAVGHFHNNFVHIAVTLGALGLAAFTFLMVRILLLLVAARRAARSPALREVTLAGLCGFVAFLVNGLFEWNYGDAEVATLLWWLVGMVVAAVVLTRRSLAVGAMVVEVPG